MQLTKITTKSFKELLKNNYFFNSIIKGYGEGFRENITDIKDVKEEKFTKGSEAWVQFKSRYLTVNWDYDGFSYRWDFPIYFDGLKVYKIDGLENAFVLLSYGSVYRLELGKAE